MHMVCPKRLRLARPLATAYVLGLLSSTSPHLLKVVLLLGKRELDIKTACLRIISILRHATAPHRFPAFCGTLVGGATLLQVPIRALIVLVLHNVHSSRRQIDGRLARRVARFIAALISASVSFSLLNSAPSGTQLQHSPEAHNSSEPKSAKSGPFDDPPESRTLDVDDATLRAKSLFRTDLAGKSLDLTLFSVIRALDVVASITWARLSPKPSSKLTTISKRVPTALFCFSAATIMHAWFYSPSRLPRSYNRWISAAAQLDRRLLLALRHARFGTWVYHKDTGMAPLLGSMCRDYGLPEEMGDPARTVPIPCEVVHMGQGKSCEKHAIWRFWQGWKFAAKMYAPLQLVTLARYTTKRLRAGRRVRAKLLLPVLLRTFINMARSSAFLGAFIALFYYGVCLSRTRVGPKLFSYKTITPQMWDSGLCVLAGCLLCGSSILVEQARKRLEILLFVLPRAAAVWFPRRYLPENRWKEHVAFTLSAAAVLTTAQEDSRHVRGVLGNVLNNILKMN